MEEMIPIKINVTYPMSEEFYYETYLERSQMDEKRIQRIKEGKGFVLPKPQGIKKDIKNGGSIFSTMFGSNNITDVDSFNGRYRCKCGRVRGSLYHGEWCDKCNTRVKFVGDDVTLRGYAVLKDAYWIIHPNIYKSIEYLIGAQRLDHILNPEVNIDKNGNEVPITKAMKANEPFRGIGIMEFKNRFLEIIEFYKNKYPQKQIYYDDILEQYEKGVVFTHTVSVFSSLLRPSKLDNGSLRYEDCNDQLYMLNKLVYAINNDRISINRKKKEKLMLLYNVQENYQVIYNKLKDILAKKKGDVRSAIGGRYDFTERSVIKQDVWLKCDEVKLPFHGLCELLQQVIINILQKSLSISYDSAYKRWYRAQITGKDKIVWGIIEGLIKDSPYGGLPVLINRNPTIERGGILYVKCVGINDDFTMSVSLLILKLMAADFDGDTLTIMYLYNRDFINVCRQVLNPRMMFISANDGKLDDRLLHSRDVIINVNAMKNLYEYTQDELDSISKLQAMN